MNREEATLYKDLLNDTKEQLANEIIQKNRELDKLEDVIYKAIEYIERNKVKWEEWHYDDIDMETYINRILDILKGSDKE